MKFIALFLTAFIVFVSLSSGMVQPVAVPGGKTDCCKKMKAACEHKSAEKKQNNDGCGQAGCTMMFSCSLCGFVVKKPLTIQPIFATSILKPVAPYMQSNVTDYQADNWKPPQQINNSPTA